CARRGLLGPYYFDYW
nr:immunoglobulin heavy chain junction region [Mus musculus]